MSYTETEIKLYVPDLAIVEARLKDDGAHLVRARLYERNVRYENAKMSLSKRGIVVRLRQDDRVRLTYKEPPKSHNGDGEIRDRYEAEVEVSDFNTMEIILGSLGYTPYMIYEKYRTTYELHGAEIVLDEMPYGNFVEIEGTAEAIRRVREVIGLGKARAFTQSYSGLFDNVRRNLQMDIHDLTFANFDGVDVPESAFE